MQDFLPIFLLYSLSVVNYQNMVLALNLSLGRACFSIIKAELPRREVQVNALELPSWIERTSQGLEIFVTEHIVARESIHMTVGTWDYADQTQALEVLQLVRRLNRLPCHPVLTFRCRIYQRP
jgi:hypothetical protein